MFNPLRTLRHGLLGTFSACLLATSTVALTFSLLLPALLKRLLPVPALSRACEQAIVTLAGAWVAVNNAWITAVNPGARWDVQGTEGLNPRGWYLLASNHLSSVDILVLQRVFAGRIPFLKFFLKRELVWVPVIGLAWWALDFPFMRRGKTREDMRRDLGATRQACEKYRHQPTSVMNFVEGTRATPDKLAGDRGRYQHLLKPKVGGLSVALATMGEQFEALLDVTLFYPGTVPSFWSLLSGQLGVVVVRVQHREIPANLLGIEVAGERARLVRLGRWVEQLWLEKDAQIEALKRVQD